MKVTTDHVREFFDRPFYLERGRPIIEARSIIVRELLGKVDQARILDLGCGDGSLSIPLLGEARELTLIDLSTRMLEIAESRISEGLRSKVGFFNGPLSEFTPKAPYDVVLCVGVLAHVPDIEGAIRKISECLEPGSRTVIEFTPNPNPLGKFLFPYYWIRRKLARDQMRYTTNKIPLALLLKIASRHGLELLSMKRHYFPLPTIALWPQRWLYAYTVFARKNRLMSCIGTEHVMLFRKSEGSIKP